MTQINALPGKLHGYFLVRDKNGKPKFDDIHNIPDPLWDALTEAEQAEIIRERGKTNGGNSCGGSTRRNS